MYQQYNAAAIHWKDAGDAVEWASSLFERLTKYNSSSIDDYLSGLLEMIHAQIDWERLGKRLYEDAYGFPDSYEEAIPIN